MGIVERVQQAHLNGLMIFVVHADADAADGDQALNERIKPAISTVQKLGIDNLPIVPLIPIQETEAWLLADRETLKKALKTKLNDQELDLHGDVERYADPKAKLQDVVRRANEGRGTHMQIELSTLYDTLGESCRFEVLDRLASYQRFKASLQEGLQQIGYL